jgi:hypothetical protein
MACPGYSRIVTFNCRNKARVVLVNPQASGTMTKVADANAYLSSALFRNDVVRELGPLLAGDPEVRIYLAP